MRPPALLALPAERRPKAELLGHEPRSGEAGVRESEDEELVGIGDGVVVGVGGGLKKVIVVRDPSKAWAKAFSLVNSS